jgi:hypothetical protein
MLGRFEYEYRDAEYEYEKKYEQSIGSKYSIGCLDLRRVCRSHWLNSVVWIYQNRLETTTMSMLCSLYRLTAEQANAVQTFPDAASELLGYEPIPSNRAINEKVAFPSIQVFKAK